MLRTYFRLTFLGLLWVSGVLHSSPAARADMTFGSYDANVHNRFDSSSFLGNVYDWTGVGKSNSTWATLISPTTFLSANHAHPAINGTVTFWETNSSAGPTVQRQVIGGSRVGNTDLWVGTLSTAVPISITPFEIAAAMIPDISTSLGVYADQLVYTVGTRGINGFAVGQNYLDAGDSTPPVNGTFAAIGFIQNLAGDTNFAGNNESLVQPGDSGAPSFIVDSGTLKLVGIHSFQAGNVNSTNFTSEFDYRTPTSFLPGSLGSYSISFDNFVPNYAAQVSAVPEPAAWALLCVATLSCGAPGMIRSIRARRCVRTE